MLKPSWLPTTIFLENWFCKWYLSWYILHIVIDSMYVNVYIYIYVCVKYICVYIYTCVWQIFVLFDNFKAKLITFFYCPLTSSLSSDSPMHGFEFQFLCWPRSSPGYELTGAPVVWKGALCTIDILLTLNLKNEQIYLVCKCLIRS